MWGPAAARRSASGTFSGCGAASHGSAALVGGRCIGRRVLVGALYTTASCGACMRLLHKDGIENQWHGGQVRAWRSSKVMVAKQARLCSILTRCPPHPPPLLGPSPYEQKGVGGFILVRVSAISNAWVHDQCARWSPEVAENT